MALQEVLHFNSLCLEKSNSLMFYLTSLYISTIGSKIDVDSTIVIEILGITLETTEFEYQKSP